MAPDVRLIVLNKRLHDQAYERMARSKVEKAVGKARRQSIQKSRSIQAIQRQIGLDRDRVQIGIEAAVFPE